jgi:hypothetical protein
MILQAKVESEIPSTCTYLRVSEDSLPLKALEKLEPSQIRLINPEYHTTSINTVGGRPNCSSPLRPSTAFFLLGLDQLNLILGTCAIPEASIRILMDRIGVEASSVEKILPVDATRAGVLVQMLTPFHKDGAMNKIRGFLRSQGMRETGVQDCFQMDSPRVDEDQNTMVSWLQCWGSVTFWCGSIWIQIRLLSSVTIWMQKKILYNFFL